MQAAISGAKAELVGGAPTRRRPARSSSGASRTSTRSTSSGSSPPRPWTSTTCCCSPSDSSRRHPTSSTATGRASSTCWSTSSRTPTGPRTRSCSCWRRAPQRVRGGRQRPVDLRMARRRHPQHRGIRRGVPRRRGHPARAELPLDQDDPRRRQRRHRQQRHPCAQGAVDRGGGRRPHRPLPGRGRVRRGGLGGHRDRPPARIRRHRLRRRRRLLPHQRRRAGRSRKSSCGRHPLQGGGRHPVLRPAGGEGPARLRAPAREPLRRGVGPAHRQRAAPGRGRRLGGPPGHVGARPRLLVRRRARARRPRRA